jgi:predicted nicotinamide N-methyase
MFSTTPPESSPIADAASGTDLRLAAHRRRKEADALAAAALRADAEDSSEEIEEAGGVMGGMGGDGDDGVVPFFSDALPFDCYVVESSDGRGCAGPYGDGVVVERKALHVKSVKNECRSIGDGGVDPRLFANRVWFGAKILADYLCAHREIMAGATVVELGAATGLPSFVAAALGAERVVVTDYPDPAIMPNIKALVGRNEFALGVYRPDCSLPIPVAEGCGGGGGGSAAGEEAKQGAEGSEQDSSGGVLGLVGGRGAESKTENTTSSRAVMDVMGYKWGDDASELIDANGGRRFDVALLAELFWADTYEQHRNLLRSVQLLLAEGGAGVAYVCFCHHDTPPDSDFVHTVEHDQEFFTAAREEFGMLAEHVSTTNMRAMCCVGTDCDTQDVYLYTLRLPAAAVVEAQ